jgi:hypothetical protein
MAFFSNFNAIGNEGKIEPAIETGFWAAANYPAGNEYSG